MTEGLITADAEAPADATTEETVVETTGTDELKTEQGATETADRKPSDAEEGYLYANKYKSIEELEKGYKEAISMATKKNPGAPEEYDFDFSDHETLRDADISLDEDAIFTAAIPAFKRNGISQEAAKDIVAEVLASTYEQMPDIGEELKKLGDNGAEMVSSVQKVVSRDFNESERAIAQMLGQTAEGLQFMHDRLVKPMQMQSIPNDLTPASVRSADEAIAEAYNYRQSTPNFENDQAAKARYEKMFDDAMRLQIKESQA